MPEKITLYHTSLYILPSPDIHFGRKNADFGQGFYLSDSIKFSKRRAAERKGYDTYVNHYILDMTSLSVRRFERSREWYDYIFENRSFHKDTLPQYDLIIGPIANDTLYDTFGITASGLLSPEQSLKLLMLGGEYMQYVVKTPKCASQLEFISADVLDKSDIASNRQTVLDEEEQFHNDFAAELKRLTGQ